MSSPVLELIAQFAELPGDPAEPLELSSLELVQLAEALEARFAFLISARELNEDNFGTAARLEAFVARKKAAP